MRCDVVSDCLSVLICLCRVQARRFQNCVLRSVCVREREGEREREVAVGVLFVSHAGWTSTNGVGG